MDIVKTNPDIPRNETSADGALPFYESPSIRVYTEEELLAQIGPAQLYNGGGGMGFGDMPYPM